MYDDWLQPLFPTIKLSKPLNAANPAFVFFLICSLKVRLLSSTIHSIFFILVVFNTVPLYFTTTFSDTSLPSHVNTITSVFSATMDIFHLQHHTFSVTESLLIETQAPVIEESLFKTLLSSVNSA